mmetsp:Transcript_73188/g.238014  ORF Transcript_73188/g.238014 Transcript_73188/m.238014 type:complete len:259 (-) Transcript_73188:34-810(-)
MEEPSEFFTWSETEATRLAFSQSGASICGATALLNVLSALKLPIPDIRDADRAVKTNARKCNVSVSEYLAARSVAGTTAEAIVEGCAVVADKALASRFFDFYPPREVDLQRWLAGWLAQGCSAVGTINTQRMYGADYWHHQMIHGVSSKGVFVTNGVEVLGFREIELGLVSPSELLIRASDALGCRPFDAEACDAMGEAWARLGVARQLLELQSGASQEEFVRIPAAYKGGITIFAKAGTPEAENLRSAPELPVQSGT